MTLLLKPLKWLIAAVVILAIAWAFFESAAASSPTAAICLPGRSS